MRLSRKHLLGLSFFFATTSLATQSSEEWLIRSRIDRPSASELAEELGVRVGNVELVAENLYKISVSSLDVEALRSQGNPLQLVRERLRFAGGIVERVQKNFHYKIALNRDEKALRLAQSFAPQLLAADNPPIQAPTANPARGNDPKVTQQWGLANSHAQDAWGMQRGSRDVVVAVIDTGIDYNHEDLKNNIWHNPGEIPGNGVDDDNNGYADDVVGYDFADKDPLPFDKMSASRISGNPGHGTHCSGVVGGVGQNALGISGVAPNIKIMGIRFITDSGEGTSADGALAINYAVQNGAKIISNSWGGEAGDEEDIELKNAIANAQAHGVLMIFAAGNGRNGAGYDNDSDAKPAVPASYDYDNIISVAAIDVNNALGSFSNWGAQTVDIAAPGVKIMSSVPGNSYEDQIAIFGIPLADWSGTSMATPHVAGAAALVLSQFPNADYHDIKARLLNSATPLASLRGKVVTGGTLNVMGALQ